MKIIKLAIVGLGVIVGTAVFAQEENSRLTKDAHKEKRFEKLSEKLDLTDEQRVHVEALHKDKKEARKKIKVNASLNAEAKKVEIKKLRKDHKAKMAEILTENQKLKLKEMKKECRKKHKAKKVVKDPKAE